MTDWLLDTLVWTALLIAAVLLLRQPVARWFGPQIAYALWALPFLRLLLPPIELPASMRPAEAMTAPVSAADGFAPSDGVIWASEPGTAIPLAENGAAAAQPGTFATIAALDWSLLSAAALTLWLAGASIFLYRRFAAYFELRDDLLADGHEVGRVGKVRLVETAGTEAPLAFGVIDKVIALPEGFLALPDRTARDLALAHEMAHHDGGDLLVNVAIQPLFALHWFNPLAYYGWLALRRDQEAACDARVLAAEPAATRPETRDAYANLIVAFASGPGKSPVHALAAPMACPVLGEKSIIHRLRSLNMTDTTKTRRFAGRMMLGAAVIAMPLTASISYAASEAPAAPMVEAPQPPLPPLAPRTPGAPDAPLPPLAPLAPLAPQDGAAGDSDIDVEIYSEAGEGAEKRSERRVFVIREDGSERARGDHADDRERHRERRIERRVIRNHGDMSEAEHEAMMSGMREGLAAADKALEDMPHTLALAMEHHDGAHGRTIVRAHCDESSDEVATTRENSDGTREVLLCQTRVMAHALNGLREARASIAESDDMRPDVRAQVLAEIDSQIENWEDRAR